MPKLPNVRRRRPTKRQKAVRDVQTTIVALPAIGLARRGWTTMRGARFGLAPVAGVLIALFALLKRRRARRAAATAPWDTSAVPAMPGPVSHDEAAPSPAAASQNGTTDSAKQDPKTPSRESLAEPPSTSEN